MQSAIVFITLFLSTVLLSLLWALWDKNNRHGANPALWLGSSVSILSLLFALTTEGTGLSDNFWIGVTYGALGQAYLLFLIGIPIYSALTTKKRKRRSSDIDIEIRDFKKQRQIWQKACDKVSALQEEVTACNTKEAFQDKALELEEAREVLQKLRDRDYHKAQERIDEWFKKRKYIWKEKQ